MMLATTPVPMVTENHDGVKLRTMCRQPCSFFDRLSAWLWDSRLSPSSRQGRTSVLSGRWLSPELRGSRSVDAVNPGLSSILLPFDAERELCPAAAKAHEVHAFI
jgi:hypothetical protein